MRRIIVSDIFGKTSALETLAGELTGEWEIFTPYGTQDHPFLTESEAYQFFVSNVGLESYANTLKAAISQHTRSCALLGFSIGASAIWRISGNKAVQNVSGALCFYGSQIRHHQRLSPGFPIQLIFPLHEPHFSVPGLISDLSDTENVSIHRAKYLHGFMNAHSSNFDKNAYAEYLEALRNIPASQSIHKFLLKVRQCNHE